MRATDDHEQLLRDPGRLVGTAVAILVALVLGFGAGFVIGNQGSNTEVRTEAAPVTAAVPGATGETTSAAPTSEALPPADGRSTTTAAPTTAPPTTPPSTAPPATSPPTTAPAPPSAPAPVVGVSGRQFVLNDQPTFLLGVSYMDCVNWHVADLDLLASRGFHLVRCWPDWGRTTWNEARDIPAASKTVYDDSGLLTPGAETIDRLIDAAAERGMVVEIVIGHTNVPDAATSRRMVEEAVVRWGGRTNVLFDVQNERGERRGREWATFTHMQDLLVLARDLTAQPVFFSDTKLSPTQFAGTFDDYDRVGITATTSVVAPHFIRNQFWSTNIGERIANVRSRYDGPIWISEEAGRREPEILGDEFVTADDLLRAGRTAFESGAAGFVLHNVSAFDLEQGPFATQVDADEQRVLDELAALVG